MPRSIKFKMIPQLSSENVLRLRGRGLWLVCSIFLLGPGSLLAWGPHGPITQAALDRLGTNHPLQLTLGAEFQRLTNYCWLADYKRIPFPVPDMDFYADDYLLFPTVTRHLDHICPEVKTSYAPYFRRALQALRTEDSANAARWIGSLLHFVEDTGSPPHAAEIRGPTHTKMENWVQGSLIQLGNYHPRSLGTNDDQALEGLLKRMNGLIEFSKERARRIRLDVDIGRRKEVEPVVLESALETSRVTADLLHTLGQLGKVEPLPTKTGSAILQGRLAGKPGLGLERFPAKIILLGTPYSTLSDLEGRFRFHGLPSGRYTLAGLRPGLPVIQRAIELQTEQPLELELSPEQADPAGNLVRNGDFSLSWVQPGMPDCWNKTNLGWEGEVIPLRNGQEYRLTVDFSQQTPGDVLLRWTKLLPYQVPNPAALPRVDSRPLTPQNNTLTFKGTDNMALLQITLRTVGRPDQMCRSVELRPIIAADAPNR